jgi:hypothetical protein
MSYSSELQQLLNLKQTQERPVAQATLQKYSEQYRKLTQEIGYDDLFWITKSNEGGLIKGIKDMNITASGMLGYLNICVMIRLMNDKSIDKLIKYRDELNIIKNQNTKNNNSVKNEFLPPFTTIKEYINDLYKQNDFVNYLVNELIFLYALRNKDINVMIIDKDKYKLLIQQDPIFVKNNNFLIIYKTYCVLIVNNYKTANTYGAKKITIRSRRVLNAVNKLGVGWLLLNNKGENPSNIEYYIKLYNGLGEGDYFKVRVRQLQDEPNALQEINKLCGYRGSSLETCESYYNIIKK